MAGPSRSFSLVGVDLGHRSVELVQLRRDNGSWKLHEVARAELSVHQDDDSYPAECARAIRALRQSRAFHGRQAATALSIGELDVRPLKLPPVAGEELRQMVRFEIEAYLTYPMDQAVVDHVVTGEVTDRGEKKIEVIAVSARRSAVERHLSVLQKAGLRTRVVDMTPCALSRALGTAEGGAVAILDIGFEASAVAIVQGGSLIFCRRVDLGSRHITQAIADKLDLDCARAEDIKVRHGLEVGSVTGLASADAADIPRAIFGVVRDTLARVADEVRKSLSYCAANRRGLRASKLLVAGGGSMMKNVGKFFQDQLNISVVAGNPFGDIAVDSYRFPEDLFESAPLYTVAVGLAKLEPVDDAIR